MYHGIEGQFSPKGILIAGRRGKIVGEKDSIESPGLKAIQFEIDEPESPLLNADLATKVHLNSNPLVRDPYEATVVNVRKSTIAKAGDGVFLEDDGKNSFFISFLFFFFREIKFQIQNENLLPPRAILSQKFREINLF